MTIWVERKEKVHKHNSYIEWRLAGCPSLVALHFTLPPRLTLPLHPTHKRVSFDNIESLYHAPHIRDNLARFMATFIHPNAIHNRRTLENLVKDIEPLCSSLAVYHRAKLWIGDEDHHRLMADEMDTIHVDPERQNSRGHTVPSRFDTVLVKTDPEISEYTGVQGM